MALIQKMRHPKILIDIKEFDNTLTLYTGDYMIDNLTIAQNTIGGEIP